MQNYINSTHKRRRNFDELAIIAVDNGLKVHKVPSPALII